LERERGQVEMAGEKRGRQTETSVAAQRGKKCRMNNGRAPIIGMAKSRRSCQKYTVKGIPHGKWRTRREVPALGRIMGGDHIIMKS